MFGARTALIVGFSSAVLGGVIGLVMGVASAYFGGWFDLIFQRVLDVLMAFPLIILALAVVAVFGTGVFNVIIAITIPLVPRCGRVVRASALAVREVPYVDAARALGFSHTRIVLRHMVPNVIAPFLILLGLRRPGDPGRGVALLPGPRRAGAGAGLGPDAAGRGGGIRHDARRGSRCFRALAIMLTVLGISLFGDALRDAIDPQAAGSVGTGKGPHSERRPARLPFVSGLG